MNDITDHIAQILRDAGYTVAKPEPEPQPKSEAETLAEIANSLPKDVMPDEVSAGTFTVEDMIVWWTVQDGCRCNLYCTWFRRWLLGVMAEYVGSETHAYVETLPSGSMTWTSCGSDDYHDVPPGPFALLIAYRDCCLAIAERRKGVTP